MRNWRLGPNGSTPLTDPAHSACGCDQGATELNTQDPLSERYGRLRRAAQQVIDGAEAIGTPDHPLCAIEPHLILTLRRELAGEPQPNGMWMSVT